MTTIKEIIINDPTGIALVNYASDKGAQWAQKGGLTRSQIRNLFAEARAIEASWPSGQGVEVRAKQDQAYRRLVLLKPKLAYQAKRVPATQELAQALAAGIDTIIEAKGDASERHQRFKRWMQLFEAILAYHRAAGGA